MKVLGLNARSAPALGAILRRKRDRGSGDLTLLIGALCRESRLPLVTYRSANFRKIQGLRVLPAQRLECVRGAEGLTSILAGRQR
jgi:predicted nucleic acid-binding protein